MPRSGEGEGLEGASVQSVHGTACMAWSCTARHSMAQQSAAQRSTALHCTALAVDDGHPARVV